MEAIGSAQVSSYIIILCFPVSRLHQIHNEYASSLLQADHCGHEVWKVVARQGIKCALVRAIAVTSVPSAAAVALTNFAVIAKFTIINAINRMS